MQRLVARCSIDLSHHLSRCRAVTRPAFAVGVPALVQPCRTVASYPSPGVRSRRTKKKKYNFLTSSRLVPVSRKRESRETIRRRDDVGIRQRHQYRQQLQQDIEEKIHYFTPFLVNFVFYPKMRNLNKRKIFTGNRVLAVRTYTRVYVYVMDQLMQKANRKALLALIQQGGLTPPTAAMLKPYCDSRTGAITNIGILYSSWMRRRLTDAAVRLEEIAKGIGTRRTITPTLAYIARYHADLERIPSLKQWSDAIGPLRQDEFVELSKSYVNVHRALLQAKREVECFGQAAVEQAVCELTLAEESELVHYVTTHAAELLESMRRSNLVSSLLLFGLNALPEIRAIQTPSRVYLQEEACKWAVAHQGYCLPPCPTGKNNWIKMSAEERASYFCFKRKFERRTHTGSQLYSRFCIRDYGLNKSDALKRFTQLSDLQVAAINYPFYYSIAPKKSATVAFRHFYLSMCTRYGLTRGTGNNTFGNRLFEAAMRKKWNEMDADERHQYFESDAIRAAFPLLPPAATSRRSMVRDTFDEDDDNQSPSHPLHDVEDEEMTATADLAVEKARPPHSHRESAKALKRPPESVLVKRKQRPSLVLYASDSPQDADDEVPPRAVERVAKRHRTLVTV